MNFFSKKVLLVDDEPQVLKALSQTLELEDYEVQTAANGKLALDLVEPGFDGVVITDIDMPLMDGLQLLSEISKIDSNIPVIVLTGKGNVAIAVEAMHLGAYDFLEKPFSSDAMLTRLDRALEKRRLTLENLELKRELETQPSAGIRIVGNTPVMKRLRGLLHDIKDLPADVLIEGETGCGKELISRYLHYQSVRHEKPFVAINCGALPESIIESELFGHEAGAFTDAKGKRIGKFEYANGGTVLLDEIESMPLSLQIKLLRVLEERAIQPLGSNKLIPVDVRVVAATKTDLKELSDKGEFRADLYYRLNVLQVRIPPLRDRIEDVSLLFEHFTQVAGNNYKVEVPLLSAEKRQWLLRHDWPGGVRELRNLANCFVLLGEARAFDESSPERPRAPLTLAEQVSRFEESIIRDELTRCEGRLKVVQDNLGVARKTLYEKMRKYNLDKSQFKDA
ncbi:sigma-54 dependent transcriptional regulator [Sessilibacter sp. MAH1]